MCNSRPLEAVVVWRPPGRTRTTRWLPTIYTASDPVLLPTTIVVGSPSLLSTLALWNGVANVVWDVLCISAWFTLCFMNPKLVGGSPSAIKVASFDQNSRGHLSLFRSFVDLLSVCPTFLATFVSWIFPCRYTPCYYPNSPSSKYPGQRVVTCVCVCVYVRARVFVRQDGSKGEDQERCHRSVPSRSRAEVQDRPCLRWL